MYALQRLNKINLGLLLFFAAAAVILFTALLTKVLLLYGTKAVDFCQQIITNAFTMLQPPFSLPSILTVVLIVSVLTGFLSFAVQIIKTKRLVNSLLYKRLKLPGNLKKVARHLNLQSKIYLVDNGNMFSFCGGILRPKIIISSSLVSNLTSEELESVLLHEKSHLQNFDPLKVIAGKTIASTFFFLPVFSELHKNIIASNELMADRFAIDYQNGSKFLKSALRKILAAPMVNLATVPALANTDHLEIRIRRIIDPNLKINLFLSPLSIFISLLFTAVFLFLLQIPVKAFQDPVPDNSSSLVCAAADSCPRQCRTGAPIKTGSISSQTFTPVPSMRYSGNSY